MTALRLQVRIMVITLRKNGSRTLLAVGAVALGIASMMLMLALSAGAEEQMESINDRFGKNMFGVSAAQVLAPAGRGAGWYSSPRLRQEDVVALREQTRRLRTIVPVREASLLTRFGRQSVTTSILGTTPDYLAVRNFRLDDGRSLDERDGAARSRVAVVGSYIAEKLNGGFSMVGETIQVGYVPFEVVGQLKKKGASSEGLNEDDAVFIPIETAMRRLLNTDSFSRLVVQISDKSEMEAAQSATRELLRASHGLGEGVKDDFKILALVRADEIRRRSSAFLEGLSKIFAAMTLTIGGAGVLAVTFLNVKERIPEIGLRMAVGARPRDVMQLFVVEACFVTTLGGVAGLVIGWFGILTLERFLDWAMAIDARGVFIPLAVSVLLGLVFSVAPALKASTVMPVEALRDA